MTTSTETMEAPTQPQLRRRLFKTYVILLLFIGQKALGNLSLAWGMKQIPAASAANPLLYLRAIFDPFVASGIGLLILALLTRMVLLSLADLSFVLPVTAVGYVLAAALGHLVLHEAITGRRWMGTVLICIGAAVVSSNPHTKTAIKKETRS